MRRIAVIALGALGLSAACLALSAALPQEDTDFSSGFLDELLFGRDKPACPSTRDDAHIVSRDYVWDGSDSVDIAIPSTIRYRRGDGERVTVRARSWVLDHVLVGDGRIEFDCRIRRRGPVEITLPGVPLRSIAVSGAGRLYLEDVQQSELQIDLKGASKIEASGHADNASLSIAGASKVDMGRLTVGRLQVNIAGTGDVEVAPQDSANVSIAGAGNVRLLTEPKELTTHIAGAGRILHGPK